MKKETLLNIYKLLDTDLTTNSLYKLMSLCDESEEFFLEFCKNDLVTKQNFDIFIDISKCLSELDMDDKEILLYRIIEVCKDDYIMCNCDYSYILETFPHIFEFEVMDAFYITTQEELTYYIVFLTEEFIRFLKSQKNIDMNKVYDNDMCFIIDNFKTLLEDLIYTTSNEVNPKINDIRKQRVKLFIDIISNKDIYEMDKEKFECAVEVVREIKNVDELKKIKNQIKINGNAPADTYIDIIDNFSSDVNEITINRLQKNLQNEEIVPINLLEKMLFKQKKKKINTRKKEEDIDIVRKILKPLDK